MENNQFYMNIAMTMAKKAQELGEVPIGCVIIDNKGAIIAQSHNQTITRHCATAHAEILAINDACQKLHNERLIGARLFVNLEPCPMCAGAIIHAMLAEVIFGAYSPKTGAVDHGVCLFNHPQTNHRPAVIGGVMAAENQLLLKNYFANLR